jgi:TIR domain
MTILFLAYTKDDASCANQLRQELEAKSYTVEREPDYYDPGSRSYQQLIENAIVGCAAVVLVWSSRAAKNAEVERQWRFAQQLKKTLLAVPLDATPLPASLLAITTIPTATTVTSFPLATVTSQDLCTDIVAVLAALPNFPPPQSTDPLLIFYEQAADTLIPLRKQAIEGVEKLLSGGVQREVVLTVLNYLERNDPIMGVREKAREALDRLARPATPTPPPASDKDAPHLFDVRCVKGHISRFNKRIVCTAYREPYRTVKSAGSKELDELHLKCQQCGMDIVAYVDCGDYK